MFTCTWDATSSCLRCAANLEASINRWWNFQKLKISIILSCTWNPLDIPLLNNGLFQLLLSAVSTFYSFITVDAVLVLLLILCIVFGFLGTVTAIIKTACLLFATCCVPIRIGQHHCLEFACDCIHKCLCLFIYAGVPYEFLSQWILQQQIVLVAIFHCISSTVK